jgi:hypothetical protein
MRINRSPQCIPPGDAAQATGSFIGPLYTETQVASAVPANGDVNPYGVAVVPESRGALHKGSVLVGNFNAVSKLTSWC